jgi:hypothetical protein
MKKILTAILASLLVAADSAASKNYEARGNLAQIEAYPLSEEEI